VKGYLRILTAVPGFFLSSLFVMLLSRSIAPPLGLAPFGYAFAMLFTIALWVAAAPLVARPSWGPIGRMFGKAVGAMMKGVMPKVMEGVFGSMEGKDMGKMMHEVMPKMMEGCFSKMDSEERRGMLYMCRSMLDGIEQRHFGRQEDDSDTKNEGAA
jgi:hypothetical protein